MTKLLILALALVALSFGTALAAPNPKPLKNIGVAPFTGNHDEACTLHLREHDHFKSKEDCLTSLAMSDDRSRCPMRPILQDGVELWMLSSIPYEKGVSHRIGLYVIALGKDVPVDDPRRMANDCTEVSSVSVVKPIICGNYSIIPPTKTAEVPPKPIPKKCEWVDVPRQNVQHDGVGLWTNATGIQVPGNTITQTERKCL